MAALIRGKIASCLYNCCGMRSGDILTSISVGASEVFQVRNYAARKGTREKAKKKKVKAEIKKVGFIPHNLRKKKVATVTPRRIDDSVKPVSPDNVWLSRFYQWPVYNFKDAIQCHRESQHPTVYNQPRAKIYANLEFNMQAVKANRYLEGFTRIVPIPYPFDTEKVRSVLVFCKTVELQRLALEAGATVVGDGDLIKNIQTGNLSIDDFHYIVAHPNILPELVSIRGLMKNKFPSQKKGTLSVDIENVVSKYCSGVEYSVKVDHFMNDMGWTFTQIGRLDMDDTHLEANFSAFLQDVNSRRPKREGPFITKCCLVTLPSPERLKVDFEKYINEGEEERNIKDDEEEDDDDDDDKNVKEEEIKESAVSV